MKRKARNPWLPHKLGYGFAAALLLQGWPVLAQEGEPAAADDSVSVDLRIEALIDDFEHRDERMAREQRRAQSAARKAAIERLGTEPTAEALAFGRSEAARDPENFSLRLRLVDLLRMSGDSAAADAAAAAVAGDAQAAQQPATRLRALLKRVRLAVDRQDFAGARAQLVQAQAMAPSGGAARAEFSRVTTELGTRIDQKERDFIARRDLEQLGTEPTPQALAFGREAAARNPSNLRMRMRLIDLLAASGNVSEADTLAAAFVADPLSAADTPKRSRVLLKRAGFALERNDFAATRALIAQSRSVGLDSEMQQRATTLAQRADEREREFAIRSEVARIGEEPTPAALAAAQALYQREPQSVEAAFHYANLLRKRRAFAQSEAIYRQVLAGQGASDPEVAARAQLNLANLYVGSGRLADASALIAELSAANLSQSVNDRTLTLEERLAERLRPNRFSGSATLSAGYDTNAATRVDVLDDSLGSVGLEEASSSFETLDVYGQYQRVIDGNGNVLAVSGGAQQTVFNAEEVDGIDRTVLEASAGPVYALPQLSLVLSGGLGYRYRLRDYDFARRTAMLYARTDTHVSPSLRLRTEYIVETSKDVDPARDGEAHEIGMQGRYALTSADKLSLNLFVRDENADQDYESRFVWGVGASYRHEYAPVSIGTFYSELALDYSRLDYEQAPPDSTAEREDKNLQVNAIVGVELSDAWRVALRGSYLDRSSSFERFDADSARVLLSLTRSY